MPNYQGHRVLVASLFLPNAVVPDDGEDAQTKADDDASTVGAATPPLALPVPKRAPTKQHSLPGAKPAAITSILDDLTTKVHVKCVPKAILR